MTPTALLITILLAAPAQSSAGQVRSSHFIFHHPEGQEILAEDLAAVADQLRAKVLDDLGTSGPDNTRVYLASTQSELQRLAPEGARIPAWAAGVAFPRLNKILLRSTSPKLEQVFHHEWAHLALDHAVDFRKLPRWFKEGFAIYQSGEWSFGRFQALASGVISGRLFSLEAINDQFPTSVWDVELAYAQSIDFVSFLLGEYGQDSFHKLIDLLARDWPFFLAIEEAYDDGLSSIEEAWHSDLKMRFTWIPLVTGTATLWFLATLIFVLAYIKKRRRKLAALERLEDEEFPPDAPQ
jgi:hypothetical protein